MRPPTQAYAIGVRRSPTPPRQWGINKQGYVLSLGSGDAKGAAVGAIGWVRVAFDNERNALVLSHFQVTSVIALFLVSVYGSAIQAHGWRQTLFGIKKLLRRKEGLADAGQREGKEVNYVEMPSLPHEQNLYCHQHLSCLNLISRAMSGAREYLSSNRILIYYQTPCEISAHLSIASACFFPGQTARPSIQGEAPDERAWNLVVGISIAHRIPVSCVLVLSHGLHSSPTGVTTTIHPELAVRILGLCILACHEPHLDFPLWDNNDDNICSVDPRSKRYIRKRCRRITKAGTGHRCRVRAIGERLA